MTNSSKNTIWLITAGAFFAFFIFGFSDNLKGPTLPALLQDLHLNYSQGGTILLGAYIGFIAASLSTGFLADVAGKKSVLLLAGVCLTLGIVGYSSFQSPVLLTLSMAVLGYGLGAIELGGNALIVDYHAENKGQVLNLMAVMHGMGSMVAPLYAGGMLAAAISWRAVYRWDLVLIGVMIIYFALVRFPKVNAADNDKIDFKHLGKTAFSAEMILFYISITVYVALELGIASWIVEFLQKARGLNVLQSTQTLSLFFGLIMVGRFAGSFVVERIGYLKSILVAALGASLCVAIGLFGPAPLAFFVSVSGLFLSIIFPTITAAVSDTHKENTNTILGLLFTFAGLGGMLGPWLVGLVSDLGGIGLGFGMNVVFGILTAVSASILIRLRKKPEFAPL